MSLNHLLLFIFLFSQLQFESTGDAISSEHYSIHKGYSMEFSEFAPEKCRHSSSQESHVLCTLVSFYLHDRVKSSYRAGLNLETKNQIHLRLRAQHVLLE